MPEDAPEGEDAPDGEPEIDDEAGAEAKAPPSEPDRKGPGLLVAVVLAAVFGVTSVFLAVAAVSLKAENDDLDGRQSEVIAAARRFTQAFVDRDADIASARDDVLPLSIGSFLEEFSAGVEQLHDVDEGLGLVTSRATIGEVYATEPDEVSAEAIVHFTATSRFEDGREVIVDDQYIILRMLVVDDEWLVERVTDLSNAVLRAAAETTSTTAPG